MCLVPVLYLVYKGIVFYYSSCYVINVLLIILRKSSICHFNFCCVLNIIRLQSLLIPVLFSICKFELQYFVSDVITFLVKMGYKMKALLFLLMLFSICYQFFNCMLNDAWTKSIFLIQKLYNTFYKISSYFKFSFKAIHIK